MQQALKEPEIPFHELGKVRSGDTERTKLLKGVMKSIGKVHAAHERARKEESVQAAGQLIMKSWDIDDVLSKEYNEWGFLSSPQKRRITTLADSDEFYLDLAGDDEFRELLKENSQKMRTHCQSLSVNKNLPKRRVIETGPASSVQLVSRKVAKDPVPCSPAEQRKMDRAAWSWVQDNLHYAELDKLTMTIAENDYDGLRRSFSATTTYHPVLHRLTDHSLKDRKMWNEAMQETMYPTTEQGLRRATQARGFPGRSFSKTTRKTTKRASFHADVIGRSTTSRLPVGGRLQKDRSAPALL